MGFDDLDFIELREGAFSTILPSARPKRICLGFIDHLGLLFCDPNLFDFGGVLCLLLVAGPHIRVFLFPQSHCRNAKRFKVEIIGICLSRGVTGWPSFSRAYRLPIITYFPALEVAVDGFLTLYKPNSGEHTSLQENDVSRSEQCKRHKTQSVSDDLVEFS
ncbi:hypothetical protein Taro_029310 [Colocasia esculenta]|uniref:Uncharacterized protein n=1 Tax=Colocasia esculenta TaxID=4460 RepID=A0A843VIN2_COLES|nr:hypothetical protein [Colocasia esculenta]